MFVKNHQLTDMHVVNDTQLKNSGFQERGDDI